MDTIVATTEPAERAASNPADGASAARDDAELRRTAAGLDELQAHFGAYALEQPTHGILDVKVMAAIEAFRPRLDDFRALISALADHPDHGAVAARLTAFFSAVHEYKRTPRVNDATCFLWSDGYRYLVRELFLSAIATFVLRQQYEKAGLLLDHRYQRAGKGPSVSFVAFDAYVRTLDEFRDRRLRSGRRSLCADLLRQRADAQLCPFDLMRQVDFILCLRSLLCEQDFFNRWYPRTLVLDGDEALPMFVAARDRSGFAPLARLLRVDDHAEMVERFEAVCAAWHLERWELAGEPLAFRRLMALGGAPEID